MQERCNKVLEAAGRFKMIISIWVWVTILQGASFLLQLRCSRAQMTSTDDQHINSSILAPREDQQYYVAPRTSSSRAFMKGRRGVPLSTVQLRWYTAITIDHNLGTGDEGWLLVRKFIHHITPCAAMFLSLLPFLSSIEDTVQARLPVKSLIRYMKTLALPSRPGRHPGG